MSEGKEIILKEGEELVTELNDMTAILHKGLYGFNNRMIFMSRDADNQIDKVVTGYVLGNNVNNQCQPGEVYLEHSKAQQLMDHLWTAGFKPSAAAGSTGQLAATQHHLQDMRKIVSNKLKVELEGK